MMSQALPSGLPWRWRSGMNCHLPFCHAVIAAFTRVLPAHLTSVAAERPDMIWLLRPPGPT